MRFFRNFPDLRGHSLGNPRSGLIFMGGGGGFTICCVCSLTVSNVGTDLYPHYQPIINKSSHVPGVCTTCTCTSMLFCMVHVCKSPLILENSYVKLKQGD